MSLASLLVLIAAIAGAFGYHAVASSDASLDAPRGSVSVGTTPSRSENRTPAEVDGAAPAGPGGLPFERDAEADAADGALPDGITVFDDGLPGIGNLDAALLGALRDAATDAAGEGIELFVQSGWRSPKLQEQLFRQAVLTYGSEAEAARWVATATTSVHVSGDAVDIGPQTAWTWLSIHGAAYGLCQIYDNEPWHYELRVDAIDHGCPPTYADAAHDRRPRH